MPASAAVVQAIPHAGVAAAFPDGELAIGVHNPVTSTPDFLTAHVSRRMRLKGGRYVLKIGGRGGVSVWIGERRFETKRIVTIDALGDTAAFVEFFIRPGVHRFDVTITKAQQADGPLYFVFALQKDGMSEVISADDGWKWNTTIPLDSELTSPIDHYPLFPVSPNWSGGVLERLSWNSEVMSSETGNEQRRSRLRHPKMSFEASFMRHGEAWMKLQNFIANVGYDLFVAPFWPDQTKSTDQMTAGQTTLAIDPEQAEYLGFSEGGWVTIGHGSLMECAKITTIGETVGLDRPLLLGWPVGTRLTPSHLVRMDEVPSLTAITDRVATAQIRFNCEDSIKNIEPDWGYCAPLWQFKVDRANRIVFNHERQTFVVDNPFGFADIVDYSGQTRVTVRASSKLFGRDMVRAYRSFLAQAKGRTERFWFPSGTHDLEPVSTEAGQFIDVKNNGYLDWMTDQQDARVMIGIMPTGSLPTVYRRIVSVERLGNGNDRLTLDRPIGGFQRNTVERISFVLPVRFDQDAFEIKHVTDSSKACEVSVSLRSVDRDGMPDIECWETSKPYPLLVYDEILPSFSLTASVMQEWAPTVEAIEPSFAFEASTLRSQLHPLPEQPFEAIASEMNLEASTLRIVLTALPDQGFESMTSTFEVLNGSLSTKLVTIPYVFTDAITDTFELTGGTLE